MKQFATALIIATQSAFAFENVLTTEVSKSRWGALQNQVMYADGSIEKTVTFPGSFWYDDNMRADHLNDMSKKIVEHK